MGCFSIFRLLVAAWETGGLVNADDSCCELIVLAVQVSDFESREIL